MKKLTEGEKPSNESIISKMSRFQKLYDVCFLKLNHLIELEIQKRSNDMKTHFPTSYKNKFKK